METELKKRINSFAEKFGYKLHYQKEDLVLTNHSQIIEISQAKNIDNSFAVKFDQNKTKIEIPKEYIFETLSKLFRDNSLEIELNPGKVLDIEDFCEIENVSKDWLENARDKNSSGGNRILFEFFNDYLILEDDLGYYKTNMAKLG